mgnify:CR=1 FL=1
MSTINYQKNDIVEYEELNRFVRFDMTIIEAITALLLPFNTGLIYIAIQNEKYKILIAIFSIISTLILSIVAARFYFYKKLK